MISLNDRIELFKKLSATPTPDDLPATGNCYEESAQMVLGPGPFTEWTLVHGRPTLTRPPYIEYGHAWLESPDGQVVYNASTRQEIPKVIFYAVGRIEPSDCHTYSSQDVRKMIIEHEHWGPWEGVDAVPAKNKEKQTTSNISKRKISLAGVRGEWWIIDGHAEYADAKVNDYGHEAIVIDHIRSDYGYYGEETWEEYIMKRGKDHILTKIEQSPEIRNEILKEFDQDPLPFIKESFMEEGMDEMEWAIANDMEDGRNYAIENWGWIRVAGRSIQTYALNVSSLGKILKGLEDIFDQDGTAPGEEGSFDIEVNSTQKYYTGIEFEDLRSMHRSGDLTSILAHQHRGWAF
jgi:hypothetical protein